MSRFDPAPVRVASHAVERYLDRVDPSATVDEARDEILSAFASARRQRERTGMGDAVYLSDRMRLVVAEEGGSRTVITILPAVHNGRNSGDPAADLPELALALAAQYEAYQKNGGGTESVNRLAELDSLRQSIVKRNETIRKLSQELQVRREGVSEKKYLRQLDHARRMQEERDEARALVRDVAAVLTGAVEGDSEAVETALRMIRERAPYIIQGCQADRDGDCDWPECPQLRDNEPQVSGRSCPLLNGRDDE